MLHNLSLKLLTFSKWAHACPDISLSKVPLNKGSIFDHGSKKYPPHAQSWSDDPPLVIEMVESPPCVSLAGIRRLEVWGARACPLGPRGPLCPEHCSAALTSFSYWTSTPLLFFTKYKNALFSPCSPSLFSFPSFLFILGNLVSSLIHAREHARH